jgi:hypothetical protein
MYVGHEALVAGGPDVWQGRAREPSLFSQAEAPSLLICYGK